MSNPFASPEYQQAPTGFPTGNTSVRLKRVGVLSCGVAGGAFGVVIGLIAGGMVAVISLVGGMAGARGPNGPPGAGFALGMGIGALIFAPIIYAVLMFIMGVIYAAFYNVVAAMTGGIEMEFGRN